MQGLIERIETELPEGVEAWTVNDPDADTSYMDDDSRMSRQDRKAMQDRREAYQRGDFGFVGVVARRRCSCCGQWEYSAGLWGIEDDSGADYFADVAKEEAAELVAREA